MIEILKKKIEIMLAIFVLFQGHGLYVKHHKIELMKQEQAKAAVQIFEKQDKKTASELQSLMENPEQVLDENFIEPASLSLDIPPEVAAQSPIDLNAPEFQERGLTKAQAIELINSLPDE